MSQNPFAAPEVQELSPDSSANSAMPGLNRRRYGICVGGLLTLLGTLPQLIVNISGVQQPLPGQVDTFGMAAMVLLLGVFVPLTVLRIRNLGLNPLWAALLFLFPFNLGLLLLAFSGQAGWGRNRTLDRSG
ncbi:MAG: hypothetical protein ACKOEO_00975 [Planctomycetaceae bacterium]